MKMPGNNESVSYDPSFDRLTEQRNIVRQFQDTFVFLRKLGVHVCQCKLKFGNDEVEFRVVEASGRVEDAVNGGDGV